MNKMLLILMFLLISIIGITFVCGVNVDNDFVEECELDEIIDQSNLQINKTCDDSSDVGIIITNCEPDNDFAGKNHRHVYIDHHNCSYFSQKDTCYYIGAN